MRSLSAASLAASLLAASLAVSGCSKKAEEKAPAGGEAPPAKAEGADPVAKPSAEAGAEAPAAAPGAAAPAGEPREGTGQAAAERSAGDTQPSDDTPLPPPKGELDADTCRKVCDHATALTMKALPPDAKPEMRTEIEKALTETCPVNCGEKGTKAMGDCILAAKTAMDLAACPK